MSARDEWLPEVFGSSGYETLHAYLADPATQTAVIVPGALACGIVLFHSLTGRISERLQLTWMLTLPLSFSLARWAESGDLQQLYVYSSFSVACVLLVFRGLWISPALAYALTYLSLWWTDVMQALCRRLESDLPLDGFYVGVGGAGARDALLVVPLLTALAVGYADTRVRRRGVVLQDI